MSKQGPKKGPSPYRTQKELHEEVNRLRRELKKAQEEADDAKTEASAARSRQDTINAEWKVRFDSRTKEYQDALKHPHRIEEQLKTWSFALNRLGIGLEIVDRYVRFTKGTIAVTTDIDHVMDYGMHAIIAMFHPIPGEGTPFNKVDGVYGWKHRDTVQADKDVAIDKANRELRKVGLRVSAVHPLKEIVHGESQDQG
jgi:hypothetical protein